MPSSRSSSPWVSAIASIVPLRPVNIAGFRCGSDTLASLGASAVWFCHGSRCHCGVLCICQRGLVLLLSAVAGWSLIFLVGLSVNCHSVPSDLSSSPWVFHHRYYRPSPACLHYRFRLWFLRVLCFVIASSLRDVASLPGRVCLSPRSGRRLFLRLPGVWLESS